MYKTDNHSDRMILHIKNILNSLIVSVLPPPHAPRVGRLIIHKVKQTSASLALSLILYSDCFWSVFMDQRIFFMLCKR